MPAWNVSVSSTAARFEMALRTQFIGRFATSVAGAGFAPAGAAPAAADISWPTTAVFVNVLAAPAPNHKPTATNKPAAIASTTRCMAAPPGRLVLGAQFFFKYYYLRKYEKFKNKIKFFQNLNISFFFICCCF